MNEYLITYNKEKSVKIKDTNSDRAKETLKKFVSGVKEINSCVKVSK